MKLSEMTKHEGGRYHDGERFLPWYTSPCLEWLMALDLKGKLIYEYGMGDSTDWYKSKGSITGGVDSDIRWTNGFKGYTTSVEIDYIESIDIWEPKKFDIIIVDGLYRDECAVYGFNSLKPGGLLILDNWLQPSVETKWQKTQNLIEGMEQKLYKEPEHYDWQTLVVRKPL